MMNERQVRDRDMVNRFRTAGADAAEIPLLLLHHTGAKSGTPYVSPLAFLPDGDNWVIFAANGGRATHPGWYHNLLADPSAVVEVVTGTFPVTARIAEGDEREQLRTRFREVSPYFGGYESRTDRDIPVVVLERVAQN